MSRLAALDGVFDLAIIGGGIIGAGIARDAARRGLRVALVEKSDYGSGTTAGSTRLIHGGLRYLAMLDFRLVRLDLRERETLLRIAPHLVRPLQFMLPFYQAGPWRRLKIRAGMWLYDLLSFDKSLPGHCFFNARQVRDSEPGLRAEGLEGAACYYDAQVDSPERLTIENILDARAHGAVTLNYVEAVRAVKEHGEICGIWVRDLEGGDEALLRARLVVNASGPWFDRVAARLGWAGPRRVRTTKGVHLACDAVGRSAVVLTSPLDGRLFFVIPWLGYSWVGTTDTDFEGDPAAARATREDVAYLVDSAAHYFPALRQARIHWTNAGVRALVMKRGSASSISRLHRIVSDRPGLISVLGGKLTGYRAIAEEVVNLACRRLRHRRASDTAEAPLPGGEGSPAHDHLASIYGSRASAVRALAALNPELAARLAPEYPDIAAQVVFSVRQEQCLHVADFIWRRSLLGFQPDQGARAVETVAAWMAQELGWSEARRRAEIEACNHRIQELRP